MEFSTFTIRLAVLLLPGLLAAVIVERLTVHPKWEQFRFGVYSLILGISTYVIYQFSTSAILRISSCLREVQYEPKVLSFWEGMFNTSRSIDSSEVFVACCISIILGYALARAVQNKWMHRLARSHPETPYRLQSRQL